MNLSLFSLFGAICVAVVTFCILMLRKGNIRLIHNLYFIISGITVVWLLALMSLLFFAGDPTAEYIVDAISNLVLFVPILLLLISLAFSRGWERLPRWSVWLFVLPMISFILVWTNPLHYLYYRRFSLNIEEIEFGPLFFVNGVYSYACFLLSIVFIVYFAARSKRSLYTRQAMFFAAGNIITLAVNGMATFGMYNMSFYSTPLGYICGIILMHGLAIFRFHMLNIMPIATETVLDRISDGFLVVSADGLIISRNRAFSDTFGAAYGLPINANLNAIVAHGDNGDTFANTLLSTMKSCENSEATISYEQAFAAQSGDGVVTKYYIVDVTGLKARDENLGFVIFFKDISNLKESAQKLQNSQARLMERERLASLGQTLSGISHNLRTPVMSISGSIIAANNLLSECIASIGDPDIRDDDYAEIYQEMAVWLSRMKEACSYMSDILSVVKEQVTFLNTTSDMDFTMDDVIKRVNLLQDHELQSHRCVLKTGGMDPGQMKIHGDINSMVQVISNLIGNSVDAIKETGGEILIELAQSETHYIIRVEDRGPGVSEDVQKLLFTQMVTSKGAMGSGLGIYMSNSFIKAHFDGQMWYEDNPGGGAVFGISLPLSSIGTSANVNKLTEHESAV